MQREHTAEEDFKIPIVAGFVKPLVRQESELLARNSLRGDWQQLYVRPFVEAQFTQDEAFALR